MVNFTNAFNILSNLYDSQNRDVIQYQFVQYQHQINISYTKKAGLSRQISVTFTTPSQEIVFLPIRIVNKDGLYLISSRIGEYMSLIYDFFSHFKIKDKVSTTMFFEELSQRIQGINCSNLRYETIDDFNTRIHHANHPHDNVDDYYNPYFYNIIHKNLSPRMKMKIYDMFDKPCEIIKFLEHNHLTLAFTDDIHRAHDFYTLFNQKRIELNSKN